VRRLLLILFTIFALIGLPRLADRFRDTRTSLGNKSSGGANKASENEGRVASSAATTAQPQEMGGATSVPVAPFSVALAPETPAVAEEAAPAPATQEELVVAIKKQLSQLGLYSGEVSGRWTKHTRLAARKFARRYDFRGPTPKPTLELLRALETATAKEAKPDGSRLNLQMAEKEPAPGLRKTEEATRHLASTYLPPTDAELRASAGERSVSGGTDADKDEERSIARRARIRRRNAARRHRVAKLHRHRYSRNRFPFRVAAFRWF
jgi:hypothetical protein